MNRLIKYSCCLLLSLAGIRAAHATMPLYQNLSPVSFTVPGNPTNIDATAFDNESEFDYNFFAPVPNPEQFETENTLFYTNNGIMAANSPISTNGFFLISGSIGCGFIFDHQLTSGNTPHQAADTFYNNGTVFCDSTNTGNNVIILPEFGAEFIQTSVGLCTIWATNIVNPGTVDVGSDGLIQMTGQNVDLTRGTLLIEGIGNSQSVSGLGFIGTDTNFDWDPGRDLTFNAATSSIAGFGLGGVENVLILTNSTSYFDVRANGPSNAVSRSVFLMDTSLNVRTNVYIDTLFNFNPVGLQFAPGAAHVEWIGTYLDPSTGLTSSNFLYLTDDYVLGAATNNEVIDGNGSANNGIPENFSFFASDHEVLTNETPTAQSFQPFPDEAITNAYAYLNGQVLATSVATNISIANPHGALTNLPGRIQIDGGNDLNLTLAEISGPSYLSLTATNQFDGSAGAQISAPFSDINLAVTNGTMAVSNLLTAGIFAWSGNIQAFSTRWFSVDSTGFTNDYRVLLVKSQLNPVSAPNIQNLRLHATNSLTISDVLNVFGSLYIDAQNLTLTTNLIAAGATSLDGELNWNNSTLLGAAQLPNLLWLTNNGAIRALGAVNLGSVTTGYGAVINNGLMQDIGLTIFATNFVSGGAISNGGTGVFSVQSQTSTITNGILTAGGSVSITASNLITGGLNLSAGRALNLIVLTNILTDAGSTNESFWSVGAGNTGSGTAVGLNLPNKPLTGDLLDTTITNIATAGTSVTNIWAGHDFGPVNGGFNNNVAIGQFVVDPRGNAPRTQLCFTGSSVSNAIYVDNLILEDQATNFINENVGSLNISTNLIIYYAQAMALGVSVAEKLNGANNGHLIWVPTYMGRFSSTNMVFPAGVTNAENAALAQSSDIDSNGDGRSNGSDPAPFLVPGLMNFRMVVTNHPPNSVLLQWTSVANGTNFVYYTTNLVSPNWVQLTNFPSSLVYPAPPGTVSMFDVLTNTPRYYRVAVQPWLTYPY